ncbi:glutaminase [Desulfopila sp. IMCC35006]|uniref:glutaminase n=1 Tax=Desulfopila sp. IMCC35006 TaxID=2569542 RepID=UPI0010AD4C99|nr:glutaminase [Desulfopila sp. IMCC35006]TKB25873.1 glutaminase [Desulfopila sp. IMCC35006]
MANIDYQKMLDEVAAELRDIDDPGEVATYIPELRNVDSRKMGIHLVTIDNSHFYFGDSNEKFSIQSISKVLSLTLALKIVGDTVWDRVGVEPSGSAFNSLVQLEYEKGIPRNPLINAGAIVVCDILVDCLDNPKFRLLEFIRASTGISSIGYNPRMAESEKKCGYRNYALVNLMKDFGNIHNEIELVLDMYFHLCSIEMTCKELAQTFLFLAAGGVSPVVNEMIVSPRQTKRINSIMQMCGFYDEAGEFAFRTGLPGKSGVGGGIVAIHPGKFSVAVWSPKLNKKGNSYKGMKLLESVTTKSQSSIF